MPLCAGKRWPAQIKAATAAAAAAVNHRSFICCHPFHDGHFLSTLPFSAPELLSRVALFILQGEETGAGAGAGAALTGWHSF